MHSYQIDDPVRTHIFLLSAALAVIISLCLDTLARTLSIRLPLWIDYPSVFGVFALLTSAYNRQLWNKRPFAATQWFRIPDVSGKWLLEVSSSHDQFQNTIFATLLIRQSGSRMSISIDSPDSTSSSLSASLLRRETLSDYELTYTYLNTPKPHAPNGMAPHYGLAVLRFATFPIQLDGEYFSGRGRHQHGSMVARRPLEAA